MLGAGMLFRGWPEPNWPWVVFFLAVGFIVLLKVAAIPFESASLSTLAGAYVGPLRTKADWRARSRTFDRVAGLYLVLLAIVLAAWFTPSSPLANPVGMYVASMTFAVVQVASFLIGRILWLGSFFAKE